MSDCYELVFVHDVIAQVAVWIYKAVGCDIQCLDFDVAVFTFRQCDIKSRMGCRRMAELIVGRSAG